MSQSAHTPGPWETGEASWNEDGEVRYTLHGITEAKAADARLIAAAPELLEALNGICQMQAECFGNGIETHMRLADLCKRAREVITKATGEP